MSQESFVAVLGGVFEHSPWVAEKAWIKRPFADITSLHQAMSAVVQEANLEQKLVLIRAHPDLATKASMSTSSVQEQAGVGLDRLTPAEYAKFQSLNQAYKTKFGFPFIVAVRNHTKESILESFANRLGNTLEVELERALAEIEQIAYLRLSQITP